MDMCIGRDEPPPSSQDAIGHRIRALAFETGARPSDHGFARMFPFAGPAARLPEGADTISALTRLGTAMVEEPDADEAPRRRAAGDSDIPAGYTYLAEFVLNDMVWERSVVSLTDGGADFSPLTSLDGLLNRHSGRLDLDSIYDAPRDPAALRRMLVGPVAPMPGAAAAPWPARKAAFNDLPRHERDARPGRDRAARAADPRNDERLVLNQLHVAFLKAHNALVAQGHSFEAARRALRQRYQWMVLFDLLERICDRAVLREVRALGARQPSAASRREHFLPVEFSAAAFVLGPAMRRASYDYNPLHRNMDSALLATRYSLGFAGRGPQALPADRIIAWEGFLPLEAEAPQRSRRINTALAGSPQTTAAIAIHHLLRGYRLGLPTGQAAALSFGHTPLSGDALLAALPCAQREAAAGFAHATPLWFYILAEAGNPDGPNGAHLGPVGTRIVATTLIALIRQSESSILAPETTRDFGHFTLTDLVLLAEEEDRAAACG